MKKGSLLIEGLPGNQGEPHLHDKLSPHLVNDGPPRLRSDVSEEGSPYIDYITIVVTVCR